MVNKISINRGMYLEEVINRTINYYISKKIIFIEKRPVPIQILKSVSNNTILGKLLSKSTVDYFGFYNSKHFEFETKETSQENFSISQILKHQWEHLKLLDEQNIFCFLIVFFSKFDEFYILPFKWVKEYVIKNEIKTIKYVDIKKICPKLEVTYPGILDIFNFIKNKI